VTRDNCSVPKLLTVRPYCRHPSTTGASREAHPSRSSRHRHWGPLACMTHGPGPTNRPTLPASRMDQGVPPWRSSWPSTRASRLNSSSRQIEQMGSMCWRADNAQTAACPTCGCRRPGSQPCSVSARTRLLTASPVELKSPARLQGHPPRPRPAAGAPSNPLSARWGAGTSRVPRSSRSISFAHDSD
jgi:hypothetical protein